MIGTKALTLGIAAVVLIGGMAAVGAAAPADQAPDAASDAYAENAPSEGDVESNEDNNASGGTVGPSDGLPDQAPEHVGQIHETIQSYLDGSVENLGQALSDLLGHDAASNGSPAA